MKLRQNCSKVIKTLTGAALVLWILFFCTSSLVLASEQGSQTAESWHQANVLYLGENHELAQDHQAELEILQALYAQSPKLSLGLEMFQRPFQTALDQYLVGQIDAEALRDQSEFDQRWGFDWNAYAPILEFAKEHHLSITALNTPLEITQKVGQTGLSSLSGQDFRWIPKLTDIDLQNQPYRDRIKTVYEQFHQGQGNSSNFEHFYEAQILWDETMAEAIANYVNAHPDQLFITLVGAGHIATDDGIPNRVLQRIHLPEFRQYSVQLSNQDSRADIVKLLQ